jgi:serine protease Do
MNPSRPLILPAFAAITGIALLGSGCRGQADRPPESQTGITPAAASALPAAASGDRTLGPMPSFALLVKQVRPAAVNINSRFRPRLVRGASPRPYAYPPGLQALPDEEEEEDPMGRYHRFFGDPRFRSPEQREVQGLGSGLYIGDGLVLTNNHVVTVREPGSTQFRPMDDIKVITDQTASDGSREYPAKIVGTDPKTDIALLRIEGEHVKALKGAALGDSDALEVGDHVIAIGEPFGLEATVTSGIISAKERSLSPDTAYADFLQTDASINPGNSGGPLFNLKGEAVGINTAIISGANNIGFAVPMSVIKQILPQLKEKGRVERGYLGVLLQPITQDIAEELKLDSRKGALIAGVEKDGPAAKAGLKPGDVVVRADGKPLNDASQLTRAVGDHPPGSTVKLEVVREGKRFEVQVKLAQRPDEAEVMRRGMQQEQVPRGRRPAR